MIGIKNYDASQVDILYSIVEEAVSSHEKINMFEIVNFLKPEDFYLYGSGSGILSMIKKENRYNKMIENGWVNF